MNREQEVEQKIYEAHKRIKELLENDDLKKLDELETYTISSFYEQKSLHRFQTAMLIFQASKNQTNYSDYSEVVAACYYGMYYIVHAYVAKKYGRRLREGVRGVHAITTHFVLYYLVHTKKLQQHFFEEYCKSLETAAELGAVSEDEFRAVAFGYAETYKKEQGKREKFTYFVSRNAEEYHAKESLDVAQEFINIIRQLMLK